MPSSIGRLGENGSINETTANAAAASSSTLRVPYMPPIQMAIGAMSICATACDVVIQAPSSKPACTAPRISESPKVDRRVFTVAMNVPINTAPSPNHGMVIAVVGAPELGSGAETGAPAVGPGAVTGAPGPGMDPETAGAVGSLMGDRFLASRPSRRRTYRDADDRRVHRRRRSRS